MSKRQIQYEHQDEEIQTKIKQLKFKNTDNYYGDKLADENVTTVYKLNQYCLEKIFKFLPLEDRLKVEQVCTRWNNASQLAWSDKKSLNFHKDYFTLDNQTIELSYLEKILTRCSTYLLRLKFNVLPNSTQFPFFHHQNYQNLIELELKLNNYSEQPIDQIFLNMKNLKSITIKKMENISNKFLQALQCLSSNIQEIHLFCSPLFSLCYFENTDVPTFEKFNSLHSLTIHGYKLDKNIMKVLGKKDKLIYFNLSRCELNCKDSLMEILNLKNLEILKVRSVYMIDDLLLSHLVNNCKNLKHLNLAQCFNVTDTGIIELSKLKRLDQLILNRVTTKPVDITDKSIGLFKNIKKLQCFGCNYVSHDGIIRMMKNSPEIELLDVGQTAVSAKILLPEVSFFTKNRQSKIVLRLKIDFVWKRDAMEAEKFMSDFLIIDKS